MSDAANHKNTPTNMKQIRESMAPHILICRCLPHAVLTAEPKIWPECPGMMAVVQFVLKDWPRTAQYPHPSSSSPSRSVRQHSLLIDNALQQLAWPLHTQITCQSDYRSGDWN
ncbi:hypothetical protein AGOR_G00133200 [Albula goreensis]|uniref:Uncharacterized protein n=1 Tax=Albula goreensis TaxID=1534307 RepID=A0A8T3D497_9TELE|nr:hypothetical protein AGOR_G00133200 [Albula goreensis]